MNSADDVATALKTTVLCVFALYLKATYVFIGIGAVRIFSGNRAPEDKYQKNAALITADEKKELAAMKYRYERMTQNDLENIPFFFALVLASYVALAAGPEGTAVAHTICAIVFTVSRYGHTICYSNGLSYPRTACYAVGQLAMIGLGVIACMSAFNL